MNADMKSAMKADTKADIKASTSGIDAHTQVHGAAPVSEQETIRVATDGFVNVGSVNDGFVTHEHRKQPPPILYEDFVVGQEVGECVLTYDETFVQGWQQIFGQAASPRAQAASVSLMLMMRAFLTIVSPRPPGNIHARQSLSFSSLPVLGDQLTVSAACLCRTLRKERRYVELSVKALNQRGQPVFAGVLTLIWAA